MNDKIIIIFIFILTMLLAGISFLAGFGYGSGQYSIDIIKGKGMALNCENKSLQEAVACLGRNFSLWYDYNLSNLGEPLNEEEFISEGGVCEHAAKWYTKKARDLGFYSKYITFFDDNYTGHAISIIYDQGVNNYCVADQLNIHCVELGNAEEEI